jgi:hypothetical protein
MALRLPRAEGALVKRCPPPRTPLSLGAVVEDARHLLGRRVAQSLAVCLRARHVALCCPVLLSWPGACGCGALWIPPQLV